MSQTLPLYQTFINRLFAINLHGGMKLGLKNMETLNAMLGTPTQHFKCIHVAGTNGKGSVVYKIAKSLEKEGLRVGLYTSPHISSFRERIQINGQLIDESSVVAGLSRIFEEIDKSKIPATFFEITTALALKYFADQKVDYVVLETGLGGRLDATNIVTPVLSIITSISLEHTEYLGSTLEAIAKEKGGIIKPYVPIFIGPRVPLKVIQEIAQEKNSPLEQIQGSFQGFNEENNAIAQKALEYLKISSSSICAGLAKRPPCRLELVRDNPPVILDVGHNPDGLIHLFKALKNKYPQQELRIVLGLSKNKDIESCLDILKKYGSAFHLVEAANGRGLEVEKLAEKAKQHHLENIFIHKNISQGIQLALEAALQEKQVLVICGTFFIMAEARACLGIQEPRDAQDFNERILNNS
ncbi:MAG: bifunctional folylpolyglutamate synthase/dihydrofolate synthase [Chlamydiales bacterium]|nr:bifunctional folylpolyglutamate synthase/dihydrofolate synthase [Chlamydiales bacterium]